MARHKKNRKIFYWSLGILLFLAVAFLLWFNFRQTFIMNPNGQNIITSAQVNWKGIPLNLNSVYLGELQSGGKDSVHFCGGDASLSNSYSMGGNLNLESSLSSINDCGDSGKNYINLDGTFPKGTLTIQYTIDLNGMATIYPFPDNPQGYTSSNPKIVLNGKTIAQLGNGQVSTKIHPQLSNEYTLQTNNTKVSLQLISMAKGTGSNKGNSKVTATLTFIPSKQTYYELTNNQCNKVSILSSEKTSNDYSTLSGCESNIIQPTNNQTNNTSKTPHSILNKDYIPYYVLISIIFGFILLLSIKKKKR